MMQQQRQTSSIQTTNITTSTSSSISGSVRNPYKKQRTETIPPGQFYNQDQHHHHHHHQPHQQVATTAYKFNTIRGVYQPVLQVADTSTRPIWKKGEANKSKMDNKPVMSLSTLTKKNAGDKPVTSASTLKRPRKRIKAVSGSSSAIGNQKKYPKVELEDYWRSIRRWDLLVDLTDSLEGRNISPSHSVVIPDQFESASHYKSIWAPLCLNEMKAQWISDCTSNRNIDWNRLPKGMKRVSVTPLRKDVETGTDAISLMVAPPKSTLSITVANYAGKKDFMINDVLVLIPASSSAASSKSSLLQKDYSSPVGINSTHRFCMLGHIEKTSQRNDSTNIDGMVIKVSRSGWMDYLLGDEIFILNIGSNVTAFREFSALCRVDHIPILNEVLGFNTEGSSTFKSQSPGEEKVSSDCTVFDDEVEVGSYSRDTTDRKIAKFKSIGGELALGRGFVDYAVGKYNFSQVDAIAAAAEDYGNGGFTLVKGPPGTGKTTTLCALLNALHIRQMHKYYDEVKKVAADDSVAGSSRSNALAVAEKSKPRILVCAPSNTAVDNVILKIFQDGFIDGKGNRYNPNILRVGSGQSDKVKEVSLEQKIGTAFLDVNDLRKLENAISACRIEVQKLTVDINRYRARARAIRTEVTWSLPQYWEIRCMENFDETKKVYFVNHKDKTTSFSPPALDADESASQWNGIHMPEYKAYLGKIVKLIESFNSFQTRLKRYELLRSATSPRPDQNKQIKQQLEDQYLYNAQIVFTTLGSAGSKVLESTTKFEVVVVDEAAQSIEPSTLSALEMGSSHSVLVGDPQQLPATIFSSSGRETKFNRSLFQRLEECGYPVHMLKVQYRMNPIISDFPRHIFYGGDLVDGPNVKSSNYGRELQHRFKSRLKGLRPFTIFDLDSKEEKDGTSLSNVAEAKMCLHIYKEINSTLSGRNIPEYSVAIITPYSQQVNQLKKIFSNEMNRGYRSFIEINTVDGFQGKEADIVIFSCVRAAGSTGIGFLSDVRRMNVALTRAKHFLFVIARCESIVVNQYWKKLVNYAEERRSKLKVHLNLPAKTNCDVSRIFPNLSTLRYGEEKGEESKLNKPKLKAAEQNQGKTSFKDAFSNLKSSINNMHQNNSHLPLPPSAPASIQKNAEKPVGISKET